MENVENEKNLQNGDYNDTKDAQATTTTATDEKKENGNFNDTKDAQATTTTVTPTKRWHPSDETQMTRWGLTLESFKRAPCSSGGQMTHGTADLEKDEEGPMLQQKFKNRHLQMIAVGGSIGSGLFIGSGSALHTGGPGGILIAWILMGIMLLNTCQAIGEMAIMFPVSGGFYTLVTRFIDPSWGFAMGWNYFLQWACVLPLELTAAGLTIGFWDPNGTINVAVWISVFAIIVIVLNFLPTGYAEEEFWTSCLKLLMIGIIVFASLVFVLGGGPASGYYGNYWGARLFYNPGGFANGFKGVCSVFVTAAFSYSGTELVGLAATEHPNPRKALPSAIKMTFWRVTFVYIMSLLFAGLLIAYDDERLLGGSYDANTSPFVLIFKNANVSGLPHLINATITISVLSIAMSCVYAGSRTLLALAEQGYAPRFFRYVDKSGRPIYSTIAVLAFFPLAYINCAPSTGTQVFNWLLALSGLSTIFTWLSINVAHVRFRAAWKAQGHTLDELPFKALGGIWGSICGATLLVLVLIAQFYVAVFPLGGVSSGSARAQSFFLAYLAAPIMLSFYIAGLIWKGFRMPFRATEIDLVTGRKCWSTAEEINAARVDQSHWPAWKKAKYALFG